MPKQHRRDFFKTVAGSAAVISAGRAAALAQTTPPASNHPPRNIIFILADDLGPQELGCYGNAHAHTPNIDALAAAGMRFRTCWTVPVCVPSRVLAMTGKYGFHTGFYNMGDRGGGPRNVTPPLRVSEEISFANLAKKQGCATALAGKWQLDGPTRNTIPACGFDDYLIWRIGFEEGYGGRQEIRPGVFQEDGPGSRYFHPSLERNGKRIKTTPTDYGPDMFCDFLIEFMKKNQHNPFLAYYPMVLPHTPIGPTPDHPDLEIALNEETLRHNVAYLDKMVGRIVDALDEMGVRENTVIIFSGDNGTEEDGKNTPTELGARVPLVVNCPGFVQAGVVSDALVDFSDLLPTFAELAGVPPIDYCAADGHSIIPILEGRTEGIRDWIFSYMGQFRMVRTRNWMLENNSVDYGGDFYYCGDECDPKQYTNVTDSQELAAIEARQAIDRIMAMLPVPGMPAEDRAHFIRYLEHYNAPDLDMSRAYPPGHGPETTQ